MIELVLDDKELQRRLSEFGDEATDGTEPLKLLDIDVKRDMLNELRNAKATGGTVRGEDWAGFADQYTRADGTVIPAWGGVPKVRGKGTVKGKKRPSGKPVTQSSLLMQDTGMLRQSAFSRGPDMDGKNTLYLFRKAVSYFKYQHAMRPIAGWAARDMQSYLRIANAYYEKLARKFNR